MLKLQDAQKALKKGLKELKKVTFKARLRELWVLDKDFKPIVAEASLHTIDKPKGDLGQYLMVNVEGNEQLVYLKRKEAVDIVNSLTETKNFIEVKVYKANDLEEKHVLQDYGPDSKTANEAAVRNWREASKEGYSRLYLSKVIDLDED